jgi:GT2 family glycosyltransferase
MTGSVVVVVLSWNGREDTLACLRSLGEASYPRLDVVVVDNCSSDGSPEAVAAEHPDATLVRLESNRGFAGGMNAGIEAALARGADHVMLLNNDTVVEPGFLEPLVEALEFDEPAAAACSQMVFLDEPERVWYAGADFRHGRGHHGTNRGYGQPRLDETVPPYTTDRACGGAMLIRSDMLAGVGLFDESLFAYAEDTDWSLRAARRGHHVLVVPASVVRHAVSKSSGGASSPDTLYYGLRNGLIVAERWAPREPVGTWARRAEAVAVHLAQALRSDRRRAGARAVFAGWRDFRRGRFGPRRPT